MKTVVVTGVSTGIGWATAKMLAGSGFKVFGSVRDEADAGRLRAELGPHFTPLVFDITDPVAVADAAETVRGALNGEPLFGLVCNAGIAVSGPLLHVRIEDFRRQIEVNLTGQLIVVQAFAPLLDGEKPGRIVMISSVSGRNASPFAGPYSISKFGLEAMAETLRRELMVFGIDVIVIAPGPIATPIWEKTAAADHSASAGTAFADPLERARQHMSAISDKALPAKDVADAIRRALTAAKPQTRYEITPEPLASFALRILPKRWVDRIYAKALGLNRKA
jgi:NAD(P)-dependent dehydrogenase (short-subunit alcohol dehydrogenase family)